MCKNCSLLIYLLSTFFADRQTGDDSWDQKVEDRVLVCGRTVLSGIEFEAGIQAEGREHEDECEEEVDVRLWEDVMQSQSLGIPSDDQDDGSEGHREEGNQGKGDDGHASSERYDVIMDNG